MIIFITIEWYIDSNVQMIVVILKLDGTEPQVLQYPVHNVSEQFSAQNTIKCDVWTAAQLRIWSA